MLLNRQQSFGGLDGPVPFQQAIIRSAGFLDLPHSFPQEQTYFKQQQTDENFLSILKVKTIAEARKLPASSLIAANSLQISQSDYGSFNYGPVSGGRFAPASARSLLRQGLFDKKVKLMVAHNANEGIYFADPRVRTESAFINTLLALPAISNQSREYIANVLYAPIFDGSCGYTDQFTREAQSISDVEFKQVQLFYFHSFIHGGRELGECSFIPSLSFLEKRKTNKQTNKNLYTHTRSLASF